MTIDTTLNVTLSSTLLSAHSSSNPDGLLSPGISAFGVYFDTQGAHWQKYVLDGVQQGAQPAFNWTAETKGEKVYVIIESGSVDFTAAGSPITQESDISWSKAAAHNFRFDSFELTLTGSAADQGNLTSVNYFGIPMQVAVPGVGTAGYNINGNTLFSQVEALSTSGQDYTYTAGGLNGQQRMLAGPAQSVSDPTITTKPFKFADWNDYIGKLENNAEASKVAISGWFNGATDVNNVYHNAGFYSYQLSWDGGHFWLSPTANSEIQGAIRIDPTELSKSIYSTLGSVDIYTRMTDGTPTLPSMSTNANNEWVAVLRDFFTGFEAGYYGGTGNASGINPLLSNSIDLNKTWNWDPTFAFNANGTNSLTSGFSGAGHNKFDPYTKLFVENTNSYGWTFQDNLMTAYAKGGPLISLWDSSTNSNVSNINLTLYADSDTPSGYTPKVIYDYLAPTGTYAAPVQFAQDPENITLSFISGSVAMKDGTPIKVAFYSGGANGNFNQSFTIGGGSESLWQTWTIVQNAGTGAYSANATPGTKATEGSLTLTGMPIGVHDGDKVWWEITVGSKTFNVYVTTKVDGNGKIHFANPYVTPTAVQVDGLAVAKGPANTSPWSDTFTVDFMANFAIDSSLLTRVHDLKIIDDPTNGSYPTPDAPVIGVLSGSAFSQLASPGAANPTVGSGELAFGWNGADSSKHNDVSKYTNKIGALDMAEVSFTASSGPAPAPIKGHATVDGGWWTSQSQQFSNGIQYTATFAEMAKIDDAWTRVAKESHTQSFQVDIKALPFSASPDGDGLMLSSNGSGTTGNWIKLDTTGSSLPNGTLLVYTTDLEGHVIGRDGKVGVSLDDAVLARIGSVAADDGTLLFGGAQSVYLKVGSIMHFAILTGDGKIQQAPGLTVDGSGALSVTVNGTAGTLHLTAMVDNTLSHDAMLAGSQRQYDEAWVHLKNNANASVEIAGSAANVNTVHFVKFDVNPATDGWSVGGVAYGNTDAFRNAVQANWDAGIAVQNGGGTFHTNTAWHVSSGTGFYAPVLATQGGDIFVIGTANVDGHEHIRMYGQNIFGFEDLRANQGSDFDYNDMIMKVHWDGL